MAKKKRNVRSAPPEVQAEDQTEAQTEAPVEPKPEVQETAPDFSPELDEVKLNIQTVDEADPPSDSVTDRELLEAPDDIKYMQGLAMHPCGLPLKMCEPQAGRKILAKYLKTHDVTHAHLTGIEITEKERELHAMYRPMPTATGLVDIMYFAAAVRLWAKGLPLNPAKALDLNNIKVGV